VNVRASLIFLSALIANGTAAQDKAVGLPGLVVLVSMQKCCPDEAWPEAERAARAEFESLNLLVEEMDCTATSDSQRRRELEQVAQDKNAFCALRIVRIPQGSGSNVEIWVNDRITGKTTFRLLHTDIEPNSEEARLTALRLVEILRASLLEHTHPPEADELFSLSDARVSDLQVSTNDTTRPGPIGIRAGVGLVTSPGGAGFHAAAQLCVRWEAFEQLAFELEGLLSFTGEDIGHQGMRSTFDLAAVRAWVLWNAPGGGILHTSLGIGAGLVVPWTNALDSSEFLVHSDRATVTYVGLGAQLGVEINRWLQLRLEIRGGLLFPEVTISFDDDSAASFGRPMVESFANLEVRIP
jgi:hypothetical protein